VRGGEAIMSKACPVVAIMSVRRRGPHRLAPLEIGTSVLQMNGIFPLKLFWIGRRERWFCRLSNSQLEMNCQTSRYNPNTSKVESREALGAPVAMRSDP